jgi:hypothetical protein
MMAAGGRRVMDNGLSLDARRGGAGGVVRLHSAYLGVWSKLYEGIVYPFVAEVLALRDGVIFAKLKGFPKVVMETDCLELVNLWKTLHGSRSPVAPILQEIGDLVLSFSSFIIQHVPRSANH